MTRRLFVQSGIAALALALTTGVALADGSTTSSGTTTQQSSQTVTTVQQSGSVDIQTSSTTSQGTSPDQTATPTSTTPTSDPVATPTQQLSPLVTDPGVLKPAGQESPQPDSCCAATSQPQPSAPQQPAAGPRSVHALALAVSNAIKQAVFSQTPEPVLQSSPVAVLPQPPAPEVPQSPAGMFDSFHLLLTSILVPLSQTLKTATGMPAGRSVLALTVLLALIAGALLPRNLYTARLRRSGYTGAARSDVGGAVFHLPLHEAWVLSREAIPIT